MNKYIIIEEIFPILFPSGLHHADVIAFVRGNGRALGKITSAGFYEVVNGKVKVSGKSQSLGIGPADGDAEIISMLLRKV